MLYLPWRNDANLISGYMSYEDKYKENQELIENNRQKYVNSNTVFITELGKEGLNDECAQDDVVTELQHVDEQDRANEPIYLKSMVVLTLVILRQNILILALI